MLSSNKMILDKFRTKTTNLNKKQLFDTFGGIIKLKDKPDLVVIYNNSAETEALKESLNLNIPVISFVNTQDSIEKIPYKIPGGFYSSEAGKMYYNLLSAILKNNSNINIKN